MKSIFHDAALRELDIRIRALTPLSPRHAGRMTPHEMICHLRDLVERGCEERRPSGRGGRTGWPWRVRRPAGDAAQRWSTPTTWEADVAALRRALEAAARRGPGTGARGSIIDRIGGWRWGIRLHRRVDRHLRQFGV